MVGAGADSFFCYWDETGPLLEWDGTGVKILSCVSLSARLLGRHWLQLCLQHHCSTTAGARAVVAGRGPWHLHLYPHLFSIGDRECSQTSRSIVVLRSQDRPRLVSWAPPCCSACWPTAVDTARFSSNHILKFTQGSSHHWPSVLPLWKGFTTSSSWGFIWQTGWPPPSTPRPSLRRQAFLFTYWVHHNYCNQIISQCRPIRETKK